MSTSDAMLERLDGVLKWLGWTAEKECDFLKTIGSSNPIPGFSTPPFDHSRVFQIHRNEVEELFDTMTQTTFDKVTKATYSDKITAFPSLIKKFKEWTDHHYTRHEEIRAKYVKQLPGTGTEYYIKEPGFNWNLDPFLDTFCRNDKRGLLIMVSFESEVSDKFEISSKKMGPMTINILIGSKLETNEENFQLIRRGIRKAMDLPEDLENWEELFEKSPIPEALKIAFPEQEILLERLKNRIEKIKQNSGY